MKWSDVRRQWHEDIEYNRTLEEELPYRELAKAVVALRVRFQLSQRELAERVGTTQSVISRLESGRHPVEIKMIRRIAEALGVKWRVVFGDDDQAATTDLSEASSAQVSASGKPTRVIVYTSHHKKSGGLASISLNLRSRGSDVAKVGRGRVEGER